MALNRPQIQQDVGSFTSIVCVIFNKTVRNFLDKCFQEYTILLHEEKSSLSRKQQQMLDNNFINSV